MIDAVGDPRHRHGDQQPRITLESGEEQEGKPARKQPQPQDQARAIPVDGEAERRLGQRGDDVEDPERQSELDEPHPKTLGQQRQQRRHRHDVEMADEVGGRDLPEKEVAAGVQGR